MIKRIKRNDIDISKYTNCLNQAINYRIYAEHWYLDCLTNKQWDCLVLNDYEAIMPLPFQKKLGVKIIAQPIYCQQLGVFHQANFSKDNFLLFYKRLKTNLVRGYHFNEENTSSFNPNGIKKINQIIELPAETSKNYNAMVLRNLIKFKKNNFQMTSCTIEEFISNKLKFANHSVNQEQLKKLLITLNRFESLNINTIKNNEILAANILIQAKNRTYYLDAFTTDEGKKNKAATGLIDCALNSTESIFDFEGSSIPSIQKFYSGFGAKTKYYTVYKNLPL